MVKSVHRALEDLCGCKVESKRLWNERRCYRNWESMARRWLLARWVWHYGGVGTQESSESPWLEGVDVESQVGVEKKERGPEGDDLK